MGDETTTGGGYFTESGRHYTVRSMCAPRFEVRINGSDRGEPHRSFAEVGFGTTPSGHVVIVRADLAETFRELGEALIAAAEHIDVGGAS